MTKELRIRIAQSLSDVPAVSWDACAAGARLHVKDQDVACAMGGFPPNPFVSHAFLTALEQSQSVGGRTGWQPRHLLVESEDDELVGAAPCYLKNHSKGEYVFDHGWADAFERAGGDYYPKLQVA